MPHGKWQFVANAFAFDAQIAASRAPFDTVRQDSPATGAELRKEMSEFMPQCAIDFGPAKLLQDGIE